MSEDGEPSDKPQRGIDTGLHHSFFKGRFVVGEHGTDCRQADLCRLKARTARLAVGQPWYQTVDLAPFPAQDRIGSPSWPQYFLWPHLQVTHSDETHHNVILSCIASAYAQLQGACDSARSFKHVGAC